MPSQRISFQHTELTGGIRIAGIIDHADEPSGPFALFAHCFTCTKDLKAIVRISRALAKLGYNVLRFDFRGLGDSGGVFAESNFETNVNDILAAVDYLNQQHQAPKLLIGHSLGGTAMISASGQIPSARAITTLASPSNTHHLVDTLFRLNPDIKQAGEGDVVIGGRTHRITPQLIKSLRRQNIDERLASLKLPHLIMHSPDDETLSISHGREMFEKSGGESGNYKSFVTLPGSDHLFVNQREDIKFVADLISSWSQRFLG